MPPRDITRRFRTLLDSGAVLRPAGTARHDPDVLLRGHYLPRYAVELFDATYYLSGLLYDDGLQFFVGHVVLGERRTRPVRSVYPRLFYKDSSLMWRVATHFVHDSEEYWIGKGDVRWERVGDDELLCSIEATANLPLEVQVAFDEVSRRQPRRRDDHAVARMVREAPSGRVAPYADFVRPRVAAAARLRIHGGAPIARFTRRGDPASLRFAKGFEPDFAAGPVSQSTIHSKFFHGTLHKVRMLSVNQQVQYLFFAAPSHTWVSPPQALTTELSTYGVRTTDVEADEDLFLPGYEYHEPDPDGGEPSHSQIPAGYAGAAHPDDPSRADASRWLDALPVIREFQRRVLRRKPAAR